MKKILAIGVLICLFVGAANEVDAQMAKMPYKGSVGVRGGFYNGATAKFFYKGMNAFELILAPKYGGGHIAGIFHKQKEFRRVLDLFWYYGFGFQGGYYEALKYYRATSPYHVANRKTFAFGINASIGIEYVFRSAPFNLFVEARPLMNFAHTDRYIEDVNGKNIMRWNKAWYDAAIGIRYAF